MKTCSTTVEHGNSHLQRTPHRGVSSSNEMLIMYYNARSILPKYDELCVAVDVHKPDVICIVETWLSADILDSEIKLTGYQLHRKDRNRHGGGVLIYVRDYFVCNFLPSSDSLHEDHYPFCLSWS